MTAGTIDARGALMRVWAPKARRLELLVDGSRDERRDFLAGDGGHWHVAAPPPGADYALSIDGGPPRPDPLSAWQPHGVHGWSRRVDPAAFPWTDDGWRAPPLATGLVYELHVGTFTPEGTFDAAIGRLDHLRALGVTHVELMPVAAFSGDRGWGYDNVGLAAVHHAYGGPEGLDRLVDACHARGLAVIVDVVWNHLGPDGNYLGEFAPYFTERHQTPWGAAVNLDDRGSDEVRAFLLACADRWLVDHHADGLRLDAVHAFVDTSARTFLEELADHVAARAAALGRPLVLIAESDLNDPRLIAPRARGGIGLDAQWSDDLHHALHAALTGEQHGYYADFGRLADVAAALTRGFVYDGRRSIHRGRRHGRPLAGIPGDRLIGYAQTHDQVGNRARGERLGHLAGFDRARIAAALVAVAPHVPMLFQGEEWGASTPFPYFVDVADPALAQAIRDGRRRELAEAGWHGDVPDPVDPATFASAVLRWDEAAAGEHAALLAWHRDLHALRRAHADLHDGGWPHVDLDEDACWLDVTRGAVRLVVNLGERPRRHRGVPGELVLASRDDVKRDGNDLLLPPDRCAIVVGSVRS